MAPRHMVAAAHPLAAAEGLRVLDGGGNAVDAALAMAGMTAVALPDQCGLGGDAFLLVYRAADRQLWAINGAGPAPLGATPERLRNLGYRRMPMAGIHAIAVPGAVAGYQAAYRLLASRPWSELWARAVAYAREGVPVGELTASHVHEQLGKIRQDAWLSARFLVDGNPLTAGQRQTLSELSQSLQDVADSEGESFYRGELGQRILSALNAQGGFFLGKEWTSFAVRPEAPLMIPYRGAAVAVSPVPSQGMVLGEALLILDGFALGDYPYGNARAIHLMVEAIRQGFSDRLHYLEDGVSPDIVAGLLKDQYIRQIRAALGVDRVRMLPGGFDGLGDTTFIAAVDQWSNAVCLVHSLGLSFGAGVTAGETGVVLNNRAGRGFRLDRGPNLLAPGRRSMSTLMAWMVLDKGRPRLIGGTPGGDGQPQWNLQLLVYLLDWGLNVQEAVEAPRWTAFPGTDSDVLGRLPELRLEGRFDAHTRGQLARFGHTITMQDDWGAGGGAQVIRWANDHLEGGSDPRVDGCALGS
ncbi:MAG: gamma-glutamyltransferase [Thermaerobacter sp.]|nr:gamma-glutamyltransferase [Thermaerobacter sp.]